jgi:hypothetical protein
VGEITYWNASTPGTRNFVGKSCTMIAYPCLWGLALADSGSHPHARIIRGLKTPSETRIFSLRPNPIRHPDSFHSRFP